MRIGDQVLVKRDKRANKLQSPFDPIPFNVIAAQGSMISAQQGNRQVTRNQSFFKRFDGKERGPEDIQEKDEEDEEDKYDDYPSFCLNIPLQPPIQQQPRRPRCMFQPDSPRRAVQPEQPAKESPTQEAEQPAPEPEQQAAQPPAATPPPVIHIWTSAYQKRQIRPPVRFGDFHCPSLSKKGK